MRKRVWTFTAILLLGAAAFAADPKVHPIWPGAAPGSESWNYDETEIKNQQDGTRRVANVTRPTLTVYLPDSAAANGTAVVICPGGGFRWLSIDREGIDLAKWLNGLGVAAAVLKYRVMRTGDEGEKDAATMAARRDTVVPMAVADGQQAIRILRTHAAEWGISADRIGIIGFSAGGRVAAGVTLHHEAASRPNFAALIYGGTPPDVTPPADAAPLFLAQSSDDKSVKPLGNTLRIYEAWMKAGLPVEMHMYAQGGHGFGTRKRGLPADTWTERFRDWLGSQGLLKTAAVQPSSN